MQRVRMKWVILSLGLGLGLLGMISDSLGQRYLSGIIWPEPKVVTPGTGTGTTAPSDAVVLFDGSSFDAWEGAKDWKADADGGFTVKGGLQTKQKFGDCQLHLEFASPSPARGEGQGRGNNGVGLMGGRYEIQVLDNYENKTYPEGQAGSVYNQRPPMVNASRKPGDWQTYDIVFTAPKFGEGDKVVKPAYVTVLHNGVLVQNHTEVKGFTNFDTANDYKRHAEKEPLVLLYHGDPVRFRNIWIREFKELEGNPNGKKGPEGK